MSQITLKQIEKLLDTKLEEKLDSKLDEKLAPIYQRLDNLDEKADNTAILVANLAEDFREVPQTLVKMQHTLDIHTGALDTLLKNMRDFETEKVISKARLDRHEAAIIPLAEKLGMGKKIKQALRPA